MHKIEITMIGGHGCDRGAKPGETLAAACGARDCPDCRFRALVQEFKDRGAFSYPGTGATLRHWPGAPEEVVDDLVAGRRESGSF